MVPWIIAVETVDPARARDAVRLSLLECGGSIPRAAIDLGTSAVTLRALLARYPEWGEGITLVGRGRPKKPKGALLL